MTKQKPVVGNFARPPAYSRLRMQDGGDLLRGPLSGRFWSAIVDGLADHVIAPMADDIDQGHERLKTDYPLGYQVAQLHPVFGIPSSALDYAKAVRKINNAHAAEDADAERDAQFEAAGAALSAVPVAEHAYQLGGTVARSLRDALTSNPASLRSARSMFFGAGHKSAAASNTMQMHTAGEDEAVARGWAPLKK